MLTKLYEQDLNLWIETTIRKLKNKNFQEVDWENLVLELEEMGKAERRSFVSNLTILMAHLLKLSIQSDAPESMQNSWYISVIEHRFRVQKDLDENPSFKNFFPEAIHKAYKDARKLAIKESRNARFGVRKPSYQEYQYPCECPFSPEQLLNDDFYG